MSPSLFYRANLAGHRTAPHIEIHDGLDSAIDEVAASSAERAFLSHSWFAAALPPEARSQTLVMRRQGGEPLVALPVARGTLGIRSVPGSYWPYRSFPVAAGLAASDFAQFLAAPAVKRALGAAWRIGPIYADDPALRLIEQAAPEAGWQVIKRRLGTSFQVEFAELDARGPWPSRSGWKSHRKIENRMAELGPVEWSSRSGAALSAALFDELAGLEAKSWQGASRDAKFHATAHRRLWEALIADPAQAERFRVELLRIGGKLAAWRFHLEAGTIVFGIATSYDPEFAKCSPGLYAATRSLIDARDRGYLRLDRGSGDGGAKQRLGAEPGPEIVDLLIVRGALGEITRPLVERLWRRHEPVKAPVATNDDAAPGGGDD